MDKKQFVSETIRERETKPTVTLTCYCCGTTYLRGHFRCCAPPKNMPSHAWLARFCKNCTEDPHGVRSHCPRHCTCPKVPILSPDGFSAFRDTSLAAELEAKRALR